MKWGNAEQHLARRVEHLESLRRIARATEDWKLVRPGGVKTVQGKTTVVKSYVDDLEVCNDVGYLVSERAFAIPFLMRIDTL